ALSSGLVEASAGCWAGAFWVSDTGVDSLPEQAASARLMAAARTTVRDMCMAPWGAPEGRRPALNPTPSTAAGHIPDVADARCRHRSHGAAGLAHPRPVELTHRRHVGGIVAAGVEQRTYAYDLFRVMEIRGQHRNLGHPRDLQEAGLPLLHRLAGAFRGYGKPHF